MVVVEAAVDGGVVAEVVVVVEVDELEQPARPKLSTITAIAVITRIVNPRTVCFPIIFHPFSKSSLLRSL